MKNKKILVLLKFYKGELNPFDASTLECAINTESRDITILTMAPSSVYENFKGLTRLGVKGVFISDSAYAGSDTLATSKVLATAIEKINPDVVFCGRQSVDGDTGQIPPQVAKRLGFNLITSVMRLNGNIAVKRNGEEFIVEDKTVVSFEKSYTLRFPSIFSKIKEVETWDNKVLGIDCNECGLEGSPTKVIKAYESTVGRRYCKFVSYGELDTLINEALNLDKEEREVIGEKTDSVYYVGGALKQAKTICDNPIEITFNGKTAEELSDEILNKKAKIVLFSDEDEIKVLASQVAVILNTGLCADCTSLRMENGQFIMTRPALGGNVTADIICKTTPALATVRTTKKQGYSVIFGVGNGAIERLNDIKDLAKKYNAEVCASRKVVDSGILPYEKQVGLTGRTIAPKVYVAFGISGAVQHTSAIEGAVRIIAINEDKNARIFDYADYGIIKKL